MLMFGLLALSSSFHVDWCALQPDCNFTRDICKGTVGTSFTRPLMAYFFYSPDRCDEGFLLTLVKLNSNYARLVPGQGWLLDTTM